MFFPLIGGRFGTATLQLRKTASVERPAGSRKT
jgi:hypothetical protein